MLPGGGAACRGCDPWRVGWPGDAGERLRATGPHRQALHPKKPRPQGGGGPSATPAAAAPRALGKWDARPAGCGCVGRGQPQGAQPACGLRRSVSETHGNRRIVTRSPACCLLIQELQNYLQRWLGIKKRIWQETGQTPVLVGGTGSAGSSV